jgi:hypothetical protein
MNHAGADDSAESLFLRLITARRAESEHTCAPLRTSTTSVVSFQPLRNGHILEFGTEGQIMFLRDQLLLS